jgi:threonine dehydratase
LDFSIQRWSSYAGQATLGFEIQEDLPDLDHSTWVVPASGGVLISGIGVSLFQTDSQAKLVGVQAQFPFLHTSTSGNPGRRSRFANPGRRADGSCRGGSLTIPIVKHLVDDFILVSEVEIGYAINYV